VSEPGAGEPEAAPGAAGATLGLSEALLAEVAEALADGRGDLAAGLATPLHPADLADLLERLEPAAREALVRAQGEGFAADTLGYLDSEVRAALIGALGPAAAARIVGRLETDDAVAVLSDLEPAEQRAILQALPLAERAFLEQGLAFPEYSAGRLMAREFVALPDYWTVGQAIDFLRGHADLPDDFYELFIVDVRFRPVGAVPLSRVVRSPRGTPLRALSMKALHAIAADTDQEQVAYLFKQYGLVSAPVVSPEGRLLGMITVDDVVDVIDEEAEDDLLKLGGVSETDVFASPLESARRRVPWLLVSMVSAMLGATVIEAYGHAIERLVALAVLMPIGAALGGNAGVQTLAVVVRALAVKELTRANAWKVLAKELLVGLLNASVLVTVAGAVTLVWFGAPGLALVFGLSIVVTIAVAALIGVAVPLLLDRLGFDPAIASSVFVTPTIDAIGFLTFLGLATLYLL
jgi:magnesium transporter